MLRGRRRTSAQAVHGHGAVREAVVPRTIASGARAGLRRSRRTLRPVGRLDRRITSAIGGCPAPRRRRAAHPDPVGQPQLAVVRDGCRAGRGHPAAPGAAATARRHGDRPGQPRRQRRPQAAVPRRRPAADLLPVARALPDRPTSSSFPSGHSASAMAFAVGVALESPRTGLALAPLAATVAVLARSTSGVHWTSDVAVGSALGAGIALLTQRWLPRRPIDEAIARPYGRRAGARRRRGPLDGRQLRLRAPRHRPRLRDRGAAAQGAPGAARPGRRPRRACSRRRPRTPAPARSGSPAATGRWPPPRGSPRTSTCRSR